MSGVTMDQYLDGKKTWIGVLLYSVSGALTYLGQPELADLVNKIAVGMLTIGVAGKVEKSGKN